MVDRKENYKFDLGAKGLRQLSDKNNMYQTDSIELSHNCQVMRIFKIMKKL